MTGRRFITVVRAIFTAAAIAGSLYIARDDGDGWLKACAWAAFCGAAVWVVTGPCERDPS